MLMTLFSLLHLGARCVECPEHGACCHVGDDKAVLLCIGGFGPTACLRLSFLPMQFSLCTSSHRWLGWKWTATGGSDATLLRWLACAWLMLRHSLLLCASLSPKLMEVLPLVGGCMKF